MTIVVEPALVDTTKVVAPAEDVVVDAGIVVDTPAVVVTIEDVEESVVT